MTTQTKDYTEGIWGNDSNPVRMWIQQGGTETTIFTIDALPDWIEVRQYGSPQAGIMFRYPYASRNRGCERSVQCTNADGTKFFLVQEANSLLGKTSESVSATSGSIEIPVSFEDGESYTISASSNSAWASTSVVENSVVVNYSTNTGSASQQRTAEISIRCTDSTGKVWDIGVFTLTQGAGGTISFKSTTENATHESGSRFCEWEAAGTLGEISVTSSADWLRAESRSGGALLSWDENTGSVVRRATVTAVSETGASTSLNFVQSINSAGGSGGGSGDSGEGGGGNPGGGTGSVEPLSGKKHLSTWQHSADSAYVLCSYNARNESGIRVAVIDVIDMAEERLGRKLASVVIDPFAGDASELKFYSVNDVVYITHSSMRPKKLTRSLGGSEETGGYAFSLGDFDIKIDPVLSEYFDRNVFSVEQAGTIETGESVRVYEKPLTSGQRANGAELLFTETSSWRAGQMLMLKKSTQMMKTWGFMFTGTDSSAAVNTVPKASTIFENDNGGQGKDTGWIFAFGKVSIETSGKWSGRLVAELWRPDMETDENGEPVNPEQIAVMEVVNAMQNRNVTRDILEAGSRIRVRCEKRERSQVVNVTTQGENVNIIYRKADNDTGCYVTISAAAELPVYLRIKDVSGANGYATCEAIHPFEGDFESSSFAEGAWCDKYGYPKTCGVFQERMVFGGNTQKPCTLWLSKTGDWSNFVQGSESTSPIFATANTDNIDAIQWLQIAKSYIMFGSLSGEWYFGGSDGGGVKPTNYSFQRLSNFGSTRGVDAVLFGESTLVAKNGGRQVVDVSYNTLSEQGNGTDLTIFAAHLFEETTITDMAATISPSSMLWTLLENGMLLSFTYETNNNVFGWARHEILDGVEAITSFRRGERDLLAMIVDDGNDVTLCELDPHRGEEYANADTREEREAVFMDQHADGSLSRYESRIIPTPISTADGVEYGHVAAFNAFDVYLKTHNGSFDGGVWAEGTEFTVKLSGDDREHLCDAGWLKSNVKTDFGENRVQLDLNTGYSDLALCDIKTDYPAPLTITAVGASFAHGN